MSITHKLIQDFCERAMSLIHGYYPDWDYNYDFSGYSRIVFYKPYSRYTRVIIGYGINRTISIPISKNTMFNNGTGPFIYNEGLVDAYNIINNNELCNSLINQYELFFKNYIEWSESHISSNIQQKIKTFSKNRKETDLINRMFSTPPFSIYVKTTELQYPGRHKAGDGTDVWNETTRKYWIKIHDKTYFTEREWENVNDFIREFNHKRKGVIDRTMGRIERIDNSNEHLEHNLSQFVLKKFNPKISKDYFPIVKKEYEAAMNLTNDVFKINKEILYLTLYVAFCPIDEYVVRAKHHFIYDKHNYGASEVYQFFTFIFCLNEAIISGYESYHLYRFKVNLFDEYSEIGHSRLRSFNHTHSYFPNFKFLIDSVKKRFCEFNVDQYLDNYLINNEDVNSYSEMLKDLFTFFNNKTVE